MSRLRSARRTVCLLIIATLSTTIQPNESQPVEYFIQVVEAVNNQSCSVGECAGDARDHPECMCLDQVTKSDRQSCPNTCMPSPNSTCPMELGFCGPTLDSLGFSVSLSNLTAGCDVDTFSDSSLKGEVDKLNHYLTSFEEVLERTVVGVYLESVAQRNQCLVSYNLMDIIECIPAGPSLGNTLQYCTDRNTNLL